MLTLGKDFLDKHRRQLETAIDEMPNADLGDFVNKFLIDLSRKEHGRQIHIMCGVFQILHVLGERSGKETAVDAIRELIFKHGSGLS